MAMRNVSFLNLAFLALALLSGGCGEGDSSNGSTYVVDVFAEDNTLRIGEGTVIGVDFSYDSERVFDDDKNIVVVVRVPREMRYRIDTSEIDGDAQDDRVGAQIRECANGDSYLIFDMDRYDLDSAEDPSGSANARLTLTLDAVAPATVTAVEAAADNETPFYSCESGLIADGVVGISIL